MKIKARAYDPETGQIITEESSGLSTAQIIDRYSIVDLFTGFVDSEGNEVYAGDILHDIEEEIADVVTWNNDWQFHTKNNLDSNQEAFDNLLIIGNKYQHKDLLP